MRYLSGLRRSDMAVTIFSLRVLAVPVVYDTNATPFLPCFIGLVIDTNSMFVSLFQQDSSASGAVQCQYTVGK